ncbi:phosphatase PAP2 family protein [Klenkia sp. LSe6-5]|uniref:Phosphatase PAP2 family protein n=1 Tax=Klenkia sesuvii TaxID=3103137 RepID=A0ABU8DUU2_9ACTN
MRGAGARFGTRVALGWGSVVGLAAVFGVLWLLVVRAWAPLGALDGDVAAGLNEVVRRSPGTVDVLRTATDLGGTGTSVVVLLLTGASLLVRDQRRLAAFVAVTGLGLWVLVPLTKAVVDRARPVVDVPVVAVPANASFPSGHAMASLVTWGVVALVALPVVHRRARPWLVAVLAVVVVAVGVTRLALGVHFVSDVLAGWALGACWLAATALAFRGWQHDTGRRSREPWDGLEVDRRQARELRVPAATAPAVWPSARRLGPVAVLLGGALIGLGLLVVGPLQGTPLLQADDAVAAWFVQQRTGDRTVLADLVGSLAGTQVFVAVSVATATLAVALTRSLRPAVFVLVAVAGELLLYLVVSQVVGRARPDVVDLTTGLPVGAGWPSGHAGAAVAVHGALALLVLRCARGRWRWAVPALAVLVALGVGTARLYVAAHHPSDVLAGYVLGGVWLMACARVLLPPPRRTG